MEHTHSTRSHWIRLHRTRSHRTRSRWLSWVAVLGLGWGVAPLAEAAPQVGKPAPDFSAVDENGVTHRLESYRGKLVVLEWTNPDCPFVQRHYRSDTMEQLARRFDVQGVVWLAVNSTRYNTPGDTRSWRDAQGFEYATLQDPSGVIGKRYAARTTPHMYVIDAAGVLRYAGAIDDSPNGRKRPAANYVDAGLRAVLSGQSPDPDQTRPYGCSVKYAD